MTSPTTSSEFERIRACGRSVCTTTFGARGIGDVHAGEVLRRRFVREPQDAAPVARRLHRHPFAHTAETLQFVVGEKTHVQGERLVGARVRSQGIGWSHGRERYRGLPSVANRPVQDYDFRAPMPRPGVDRDGDAR